MKKLVMVAGIALLICGCTTVQYTDYPVISFAEVSLKDHAKIKIVSGNKGESADRIVATLKKEFAANKQYKVVEKGADYWFVISDLHQYKMDAPQGCVDVVKNENKSGGSEVLKETVRNFTSASRGVSVAIYQVDGLVPFHYFEVPLYDGEKIKGKGVKAEKIYDDTFAKMAVSRIKDVFLTQEKIVKTPIPLDADPVLRDFFDKKDWSGFMAKYKELGPIDLKTFTADILSEKYEGKDADLKLCNYYLYLLAKEIKAKDVATLKKVADEHLLILEATQSKGLSEAAPVALARIEYKLANLGAN